jgi:hypothetical protein
LEKSLKLKATLNPSHSNKPKYISDFVTKVRKHTIDKKENHATPAALDQDVEPVALVGNKNLQK